DRHLAAEAERLAVGHAQGQDGGDGSVGGVASSLEDRQPGRHRLLAASGHRALLAAALPRDGLGPGGLAAPGEEGCKEDNSEHQNLLRRGSLLRGRGPWDTAWLAPIFGRAMPRRKTLRQNPACPPGPCLLARPFGARSQPFRRGACPARGKPRGEI